MKSILLILVPVAAFASPSEVVFPAQELPLRFSHKKHLAKNIECDFCHEKAPGSKLSSDNLIPNEEVCSTCHPVDREHPEKVSKSATACAFCHPQGVDKRVFIPAPNLRFDHSVHVKKGVPCAHCHDMGQVDVATRAQLPEMATCLECHDAATTKTRGQFHAPARCITCHPGQPDNTLVQVFPSGILRPSGKIKGDAHTIDFRTHHAAVAKNDEKYCQSCHRQDFCASCHNSVVKPFDFHGNDYISRHPIEARRNDPNCGSCHRGQSFCLSCHERMGVVDAKTGRGNAFTPNGGTRTFHPPGWSNTVATNNPNHHAWEAQRNLRQCVACHRQETCLQCHASNGINQGAGQQNNVSPHPPDWAGSNRCQSLADRNVRMCLRCHAASDPHLSCRR
jgi:hypothetical protein